MFFFPPNEINILISGLLPELGLVGACFSVLGVIELLEGEAFNFREVFMMNCISTQLWPQWVMSY